MKKLYILRHAKAGQTNKNIRDDHERPLTDKGIKQCQVIGEYLKGSSAKIDYVLASTSQRTTETNELTQEALGKKIKTEYISKLYLGSANDILNTVAFTDDKYKSVIVVGHNPGLHQFAVSLIKDGERSLVKNLAYNYPPGSLAVLEFDIKSWSDLGWRSGNLVDFLVTKGLVTLD